MTTTEGNETAALPWGCLADAHARLEDARRATELAEDVDDPFARHDAAEDLEKAQAEYDRSADHMGALGALLLLMAVQRGCIDRKLLFSLSEALGVSLCFDMAKKAKRHATWAEQQAKRVLAECDALRCRVAELEEKLANRTPGVGEPGRVR